ncbi:MAG: TraE/TraK family type IV conjugative transfer system protein [Thermodesulfobacteriota bacterium]|nr:TraE/TraK family type IV conjugative transfer system protein [Thermodesulfobacteriota bacterium]
MSNLWAENRLLKFAVLIIAISSVASAALSIYAIDREKVVILPPVVDERIVISGNEVNEAYIRLFARYSTSLFLNYSPATFSSQAGDLLKLAAPDFFQSLHKQLLSLKDTIRQLQVSSVFYPERITINFDKKEVTVQGMRRQDAQHSIINEGIRVYKIKYAIIHGRFFLEGIKNVSSK